MNRKLIAIARRLRKSQTFHEQRLWQLLRAKRLNRYKFRRQYPVGKYVVDFCCLAQRLVIELDGGQHNDRFKIYRDKIRDGFFIRHGFAVLRFWNNEVDDNIEGVYQRIQDALNGRPLPNPPQKGEGKKVRSINTVGRVSSPSMGEE